MYKRANMTRPTDTRGILDPARGLERFRLERVEPSPDLAPFVARHWIVRWDLPPGDSFEQEILPHPNVNLSFQPGRSAVTGIGKRRFVARLEGRGRVVAVKFRPGAFTALTALPMSALVDCALPAADVLGPGALEVERSVVALGDAAAIRKVEAFLRAREPRAHVDIALVDRLVEQARDDRSMRRAEELARAAGMSLRSLHRLFRRHLGVGPKWLLCRLRVHDAAERVASGARVAWAALAHDLGYHDQAHLIREFKAQIGLSPDAYARRCAASSRGAQPAGAADLAG